MTIASKVNVKKRQLIAKAKKKWLYENFWQKELRSLIEEFNKTYWLTFRQSPIYLYRWNKTLVRDYNAIVSFEDWISNINLSYFR